MQKSTTQTGWVSCTGGHAGRLETSAEKKKRSVDVRLGLGGEVQGSRARIVDGG